MATTSELLKEQRAGAEILHNGAPVEYAPRQKGDRQPWIYSGDGARYTAAQCHAYREGK